MMHPEIRPVGAELLRRHRQLDRLQKRIRRRPRLRLRRRGPVTEGEEADVFHGRAVRSCGVRPMLEYIPNRLNGLGFEAPSCPPPFRGRDASGLAMPPAADAAGPLRRPWRRLLPLKGEAERRSLATCVTSIGDWPIAAASSGERPVTRDRARPRPRVRPVTGRSAIAPAAPGGRDARHASMIGSSVRLGPELGRADGAAGTSRSSRARRPTGTVAVLHRMRDGVDVAGFGIDVERRRVVLRPSRGSPRTSDGDQDVQPLLRPPV